MASAVLPRRGAPAAGVTAPGDKRFRRPDVRPSSRRGFATWCRRIVIPLVWAAAVAALGYTGVELALTHRLFLVSRITVTGNSRLASAEAEALLPGVRGRPIFAVDLDGVRHRLMDSPWVADALVRRVLPATIEVRILERVPMAIARVDGRLYLVDEDGVIMDEFGPEYRDFDLPLVDGLVAAAASGASAVDPSRAALVQRLLTALAPVPPLRQRVSQIDVSNERDAVLVVGGDTTLVHLGDTRFLERLTRYEELRPALEDRLQEIEYVDMRFDERVYVKSKTTARRPK